MRTLALLALASWRAMPQPYVVARGEIAAISGSATP